MNSTQAWHNFWSGFGWDAYDSNSVPSKELNPSMPRITYEVARSEFGNVVNLSAYLWDRSFSWENISLKEDEIYKRIGLGGVLVEYDEGMMWIKRGNPFSQRIPDEDDSIRRIYINVDVEYFTHI